MTMNFKGAAKRIDDVDLPRLGSIIGVGEDEIHAVLEVESSGTGFDKKGRPKMLFEPHVFYRNLKGDQQSRAVTQGLAYAKWRRDYPADSYPRLLAAMEINEEAALRSASWGLGQILGENHKSAGYPSAKAMVLDFMEDEDKHLGAMINFIKLTGLDDNLRDHDWRGFAKGYNGAGYEANNYHNRLAASYAKWCKIKDTPWTIDEVRVQARVEEKFHNTTPPTEVSVVKEEPIIKPAAAAASGIITGGVAGTVVVASMFDWTSALIFAGLATVTAAAVFIIARRKSS